MKKSVSSKKGSCISFMTGSGGKDEACIELMRISLKKEGDRRERLDKLLAKYESIRTAEKLHIKTIKANIIVRRAPRRNSRTSPPSPRSASWSTPTSSSTTTSPSKRGSSSA